MNEQIAFIVMICAMFAPALAAIAWFTLLDFRAAPQHPEEPKA